MQVTEVTDIVNLDCVVPFFQPIMDLENNAVWSYECLARLLDLEETSYLPSEFLFLVERQQSVAQLTQTVFSRSASYFRDINMAWNINLSLADMIDTETLHFLESQLQSYPNPQRISIEITAKNALAESSKFDQFCQVCNGLGVNIVIDNFDQQGCDLKALFALPIAAIKVSAALFDDAKTEQETKTFLENLIDSANHNNIAVIAERIESKDTLEIVKQLDVKYAQGFYFRHPMPNTD